MERKGCEAIERTIFEESVDQVMLVRLSIVHGHQITMKLIIVCSVLGLCDTSAYFVFLTTYYTRLDTHVL